MNFWEILAWTVAGGLLITVVPYSITYWFMKGKIHATLELMQKTCNDPSCLIHEEEQQRDGKVE